MQGGGGRTRRRGSGGGAQAEARGRSLAVGSGSGAQGRRVGRGRRGPRAGSLHARGWGVGARRRGSWRRARRGPERRLGGAGRLPTAGEPRERGGRRNRRRRGRSRARSCHPAAGPRQTTPARGGARTAPRSPNNAPRRPAARPRERGPEVSRHLPARSAAFFFFFCLASGAAEGGRAVEGHGGLPRGNPVSASPGVTGAPCRRCSVGTACARACGAEPGGPARRALFPIHWRIALLEWGKLCLEFREGTAAAGLGCWARGSLGAEDSAGGLQARRLPFGPPGITVKEAEAAGLLGPGPGGAGLGGKPAPVCAA